jgi:hypothetical protein
MKKVVIVTSILSGLLMQNAVAIERTLVEIDDLTAKTSVMISSNGTVLAVSETTSRIILLLSDLKTAELVEKIDDLPCDSSNTKRIQVNSFLIAQVYRSYNCTSRSRLGSLKHFQEFVSQIYDQAWAKINE